MTFVSVNPATGEVLSEHSPSSAAAVDAVLAGADAARASWRALGVDRRAAALASVARALRSRQEELATTVTLEMGKPIAEARAEVEKSARALDWYAEHAARLLAAEGVVAADLEADVVLEPLGPVLGIMPWNFPVWQVVRAAAPALAAGNPFVLKHARNVLGCASMIVELFSAALPERVFAQLVLTDEDVAAVIADDRVRAVTFTGSERGGAAVAAAAGAAVKKCVLELGGSDAFIVLADADIDAAVQVGVKARFQNSGQSCIAAKRFVLVGDTGDFEARFAEAVASLRVGDPFDPATEVGPLARADLRDALRSIRDATVEAGARVLVSGDAPDTAGWFVPATVLTGVTAEMPAAQVETFGPLAALFHVGTVDEAVELANGSRYGLGASVWTADESTANDLARRLEVGTVTVNGMTVSDPRIPIGGVKRSGYGRELGSWGMHEFVNVKTIRRQRTA